MASSEKINETITKMRRRVLEIDALIAEIERGQLERAHFPVTANGVKRQLHWVRFCRTRRDA